MIVFILVVVDVVSFAKLIANREQKKRKERNDLKCRLIVEVFTNQQFTLRNDIMFKMHEK